MIQEVADKLRKSLNTAILGKKDAVDLVIAAMLARGHVLLDDIPGTGKTTLARCLAASVGCESRRIQFTPDLLPSDLTGLRWYNQKTQDFAFRKGPVFTGILLADEINRGTPRVQSALLECMEERQVTLDGERYPLAEPFFVIATRNPVETAGTYPLPEAQLDRFLVCVTLGYPAREDERAVLQGVHRTVTESVVTSEALVQAQAEVDAVRVSDAVLDYLLSIADATRNDSAVQLGLSTRGLLALQKTAKSRAAMQGRDFVIPEDVQTVAGAVIAHRLILRGGSLQTLSACHETAQRIVAAAAVPTEKC